MTNKLLILLSMIFILFAFTFCGEGEEKEKPEEPQTEEMQEPETLEPAKPDFTETPLKGKVVCLTKMLIGEEETVDVEKAVNLANKGFPVVVKSQDNGEIYFICNPDGSFAAKKLARHADEEIVEVYGEYKEIKDLKVVLASKIQ